MAAAPSIYRAGRGVARYFSHACSSLSRLCHLRTYR